MKKTITSLAIGSMLCAAGAQAQQASAPDTDVTRRAHMERMDTDRNGAVSRSEYQVFMDDAFVRLDQTRDGYLAQDEMAKVVTAEQFSVTDANGDGRISKAEFSDRVMSDFAASDTDGDGLLR
ncbi:EF-hand domain-containing protein [Bordetella sp. 2513F-2]